MFFFRNSHPIDIAEDPLRNEKFLVIEETEVNFEVKM